MKRNFILLVDDEPIILKSFTSDLKDAEYLVDTASSGKEAIEKIQKNDYNLVVTDLMMEGLDGIQVLKFAKKKDSELGVIILTGYGELASAVDALRLGADDYLLKPCDTDELLIRISNCLEKQMIKKKVRLYEEYLPICCVCHEIRDDTGVAPGEGTWTRIDSFIIKRTNSMVTHTYCPKCYEKALQG